MRTPIEAHGNMNTLEKKEKEVDKRVLVRKSSPLILPIDDDDSVGKKSVGSREPNDTSAPADSVDLLAALHPLLYVDRKTNRPMARSAEGLLLPCPFCYQTVITRVKDPNLSCCLSSWCFKFCKKYPLEHQCPSCHHLIAYHDG